MKRKRSSELLSYSWNVNGLRSCLKKGFLDWLEECDGDVIMLQETRAFEKDLPLDAIREAGYLAAFNPAEKAGYSGVASFVHRRVAKKADSLNWVHGFGKKEFDCEGRWLEAHLPEHSVAYISAYFPNSQREGVRLPYKLGFCKAALARMRELRREGTRVVLAGDLNIAHEERDLANPKTNQKNAGFLPEERAWFTSLLKAGYVDTFRMFESGNGHYTWWSQRAGVRERNIGWRIDYHVISEDLETGVIDSRIIPEQMGSDHCPIALRVHR